MSPTVLKACGIMAVVILFIYLFVGASILTRRCRDASLTLTSHSKHYQLNSQVIETLKPFIEVINQVRIGPVSHTIRSIERTDLKHTQSVLFKLTSSVLNLVFLALCTHHSELYKFTDIQTCCH